MNMRTLVVEDDVITAQVMASSLSAAGFVVEVCRQGEDAWFLGATEDFDVVFLDLVLPQLDGLTVLRRWRKQGRDMAVIAMAAKDGWSTRVETINLGADDFLTKPFQMEEMIARARAVLRRKHGYSAPHLTAGDVVLDTSTMRVAVEGRPIRLSGLEYRLLSYLLHHKGRVVPGTELGDRLYRNDEPREANAIEALILRLRRKLGVKIIETRRGLGYCARDN
ncbi:response regulator transcription factor [Hyphomicrobium sp. ghe19]|uniref:response regulator transcription factor n=1 Tax=Hyphomicrobium sp. ghe19 TaxID=2682968 RepID=UPI001366ABAE|nr:Transcriptional regulatory protein QseB [Hyphomicrobium sp. ghe19]